MGGRLLRSRNQTSEKVRSNFKTEPMRRQNATSQKLLKFQFRPTISTKAKLLRSGNRTSQKSKNRLLRSQKPTSQKFKPQLLRSQTGELLRSQTSEILRSHQCDRGCLLAQAGPPGDLWPQWSRQKPSALAQLIQQTRWNPI